MPFVRACLLALTLGTVIVPLHPASASQAIAPLPPGSNRMLVLPGAHPDVSNCTLGLHGEPLSSDNLLYFYNQPVNTGGNDRYWTYLELGPDSCAGCDQGKQGDLAAAHVTLYFPFAPETVTVAISVVQNQPFTYCNTAWHTGLPDNSGSYTFIYPPTSYTFDVQDPLTTQEIVIPIPPGYPLMPIPQLDGRTYAQAWLGVEFVTASDTTKAHRPQLAIQGTQVMPCMTCKTWSDVGNTFQDLQEWCVEFAEPNPVMFVETRPCESVAAKRTSWGKLKMMYR